MAPSRFRHRGAGGGDRARERREVTPFSADERRVAETADILLPVSTAEEVPAEWRRVEAPPNFTWVCQDELAGMGWPKSRDQVRFLVEQGIDRLVTLSADKIPPHYAFPDLKWSLIPVEDFHGPAIRDIKKFLNIMDCARKEGEAVAVHCAEGRGRTGVMCACFLIYYYDLKPWDAIRIMRRQRPGSVERRVQEDTVVMFYQLLQDYGKEALEDLEAKEKEWKEAQRLARAQKTLLNCQNLLPTHTASFYGAQQRPESKIQRLERLQQRMRRCRSMPKMSQEEEEAEKNEMQLKMHMQNFYSGGSATKERGTRAKSQPRDRDNNNNDKEQSSAQNRAVTPGRALVENLKKTPVPKRSEAPLEVSSRKASSSDLAKHFKSFMTGPNSGSVKRVRSFSQPKDRDNNKENNALTVRRNKDDTSSSSESRPVSEDSSSTADTSSTISLMSTGGDSSSDCGRSSCSQDNSIEQDKSVGEEVNDDYKLEEEEEEEVKEEDEVKEEEMAVEVRPQEMVDVSAQAITTRRSSINNENEHENNSGTTSAAKRYLRRKKERAKKEAAENVNRSEDSDEIMLDNRKRRSSIDSTSSETGNSNRPKPPQYTPKYMVDSSATYSYYTRLRQRPGSANEDSNEKSESRQVPSSNNDNKNENSHKRRSRTMDREVRVMITVTESLSPSPSITNIPSLSSPPTHHPVRQYSHSNSNDRLVLPSVCEDTSSSNTHARESPVASITNSIRNAFRSSRRSSVSSRSSLEDGYTTPHFKKGSKKNSNSTLSLESAISVHGDSGAETSKKDRKRRSGSYRRSRTNPLDEALDIIAKENQKKMQQKQKKKSSRDSQKHDERRPVSRNDNEHHLQVDNSNNDNYNNGGSSNSNSNRRSAAIRRARDERAASVFSYISSSSSTTASTSAWTKSPSPTTPSYYLDNSLLRRSVNPSPSSTTSASYVLSRPATAFSPFSRRSGIGGHRYSRFLHSRETYL